MTTYLGYQALKYYKKIIVFISVLMLFINTTQFQTEQVYLLNCVFYIH